MVAVNWIDLRSEENEIVINMQIDSQNTLS